MKSEGQTFLTHDATDDDHDHDSLKRTPLYDIHRQLGAKMVPFAG